MTSFVAMAWGARGASAVNDLVQRIVANDVRMAELHVMASRKLDDDALKALCTAFHANTECKTLYASGHPVSAAGAATIADMLLVNRSLRNLCIGDTQLGDSVMQHLGRGLGERCCLHYLDMENKGLTAQGVIELFNHLKHNTELRKLVLSKNKLGADGWSALAGAELKLTHLDLQACDLPGDGLGAFLNGTC